MTSHPPLRIADGFPNERLVIVPEARCKQAARLPVLRELLVSRLGMFQRAENHFIQRPRGSGDFVLIYCVAGKGGGCWQDRDFLLETGDLVVLPPGGAHSYHADRVRPWSILWFHFSGRRAADFAAALDLNDGLTLHVPRVEELQLAFEDVYRHTLDGFSDAALLCMATGFMRLAGLFRRYARSRNPRARESEARVLKALEIIRSRLTERWTVEKMAALAHMSPAHFSHCFRAQTGESPLRFLTHQRMQHAAAQLHNSRESIQNIAAAAGYPDPYYFSRIFKSTFGLSPRAYRGRTH